MTAAPHRPRPAEMHLTVHPGEEVVVPLGARVGDLRLALAQALARPDLVDEAWTVTLPGDLPRAVDDDQVTGVHPLLPGAVVRAGSPARRPPAGASGAPAGVLSARWHVAVVAGDDAGTLTPLHPHEPVVVAGVEVRLTPRGVRVSTPRDARWVRARRGRARTSGGAPSRLAPAHPGARWHPSRRIVIGTTTLALRPRPEPGTWGFDPAEAPDPGRADAAPPSPATLLTALVPAVGSLVLATVLRQPMFLVLALLSPLTLLAPRLIEAGRLRRGRRAAYRPPLGTPTPGSPPRGRGVPSSGWSQDPAAAVLDPQAHGVPDVRPADLVLRATAAVHEPPGARTAPAPAQARATAPTDAPAPDVVAVVGPGRRAAATAYVAHLVATGHAVEVLGPPSADWAWTRWLGGRALRAVPPHEDRPRVLVVDAPDATVRSPELARWWSARRPHERAVVVVASAGAVPGWCRTVLHAETAHDVWTVGAGAAAGLPPRRTTAGWGESFARLTAAAEHLGTGPRAVRAAIGARETAPAPGARALRLDPADPSLPGDVALADLLHAPQDPGASWVRDRWASARSIPDRLSAPLGRTATGTFDLDLSGAGPHALVAGTTGAGKSVLLQSLVLGLALTCPPDRLQIVLVDFKGGTSLGACTTLPHVVGTVTDLEPGLAGRALDGLRAELSRRARLVADAGATHVDDLPPGMLPRLLVVLDEFRALADDLPQFLPGLLRIAAQGRSLGIHLVLATQRPSGAVSADIRANVPLRVALRVMDAADSTDLLDVPHAARIPAVPGRAIARGQESEPVTFQCARVDGPRASDGPRVRRAPPWGARDDLPFVGEVDAGVPPVDLVALVHRAAQEEPPRPRTRLWAPELPRRATATALLREDPDLGLGHDPGAGAALAIVDLPTVQGRGLARWEPALGPLAVLGRPRSGRTTALATVATALLDHGVDVHVVAKPAGFAHLVGHPGLGTLVGPDDPGRAARLLRRLLAPPGGSPQGSPQRWPRQVLLVDDAAEVAAALDDLPGTSGQSLLADVLGSGTPVALAGEPAPLARLTARAAVRVVMTSHDRHDDIAAGVPAELAGRGGPPGRGVWTGPGGPATACQVLLPDETPAVGAPRTGPAPLRLVALPPSVGSDAAPDDARRPGVVVGLGDDGAVPVAIDPAGGLLVVGPPGSGRTSALVTLVAGIARRRIRVVAVGADPALATALGGTTLDSTRPGSALLVAPSALGTALDLVDQDESSLLVVDDLDDLVARFPADAERVVALVRDGRTVVATARSQNVAMAHRGPLAALRSLRHGIVLGRAERGIDDLLATPVALLLDPRPSRPGRGALVVDGRAVPVQLVVPDRRAAGTTRAVGTSAGRVLDHGPQHEPDDQDRGHDHERHAPQGATGLDRPDPHHELEQLPREHGCASDPAAVPQTPSARDEERDDAEREHREPDRETTAVGRAGDGVPHEHERDDDEREGLERDTGEHHEECGRAGASGGRVGGNVGGVVGHGRTHYA